LLGVIVLRIPVRHLFGPRTAYQLWALVPLAIIATLLPAPTLSLHLEPAIFPTFVSPVHAVGIASTHVDHSLQWLCLWLTGVIATASWFGMQQLRFLHNLGNLTDLHNGLLASSTIAGVPALVGALKPRIILPGDFASRYTARERKLILAHERSHLLRGDAQLNVLALGLRCLNWFNPLFHFAHKYYRFDQELSCDALVIAQFPAARRAYADAMLKTYDFAEISAPPAPLPAGCLWLSTHPLQERIRMLKKPLPGRTRTSAGSLSALLLIAFSSYSAWAAQQPTTPQSMSAADTGEWNQDV
jgi:beta-lactamase regulating signal transducer with metallopeptidase domain